MKWKTKELARLLFLATSGQNRQRNLACPIVEIRLLCLVRQKFLSQPSREANCQKTTGQRRNTASPAAIPRHSRR